ncbi:holo-[acyl-carrier-protein] synthase [Mariprofundus sp. EBB-1]|uniref:holo-ACP synthase n=1 Tax=Mariprofundus sp. EBB-1 TaxID=2650971 RepID=UPI000EF23640|nr:holo-ACP synthase [Mariprofundus sp. EBB-1]RLL55957.1 holo-[acyl-carrier-protein] synthase [Mariprofundus sp. EBB-1]
MITGIGVDRIAIKRVEAAIARHGERFITRLFTAGEIAQARAKGNPVRRFAMLFAAKEAVSKALGTGLRQGVTLQGIETIHQASGKPEVTLYDGAKSIADGLNIRSVHLSLTDDDGVAMAFAVAETAD